MRFIVDESTGAGVVLFLRDIGLDTISVSETMPQADDSDILSRAADEKRILITNDKDFGELVFRSGQIHHGVVLLRLHDERGHTLICDYRSNGRAYFLPDSVMATKGATAEL